MLRPARPECVLLLAAIVLGGCGSTPRDEFIYNRQVVIRPQPGDGSRIAGRWNTASTTRPVASGTTPIASRK
jgi:hypothetical protein